MKKILNKVFIGFAVIILIVPAIIYYGHIPGWKSKLFSESATSGVSCYKNKKTNEVKKYTYTPCTQFVPSDWVRYVKGEDSSKLILWMDGGPVTEFSFSERVLPKNPQTDKFLQKDYGIDKIGVDIAFVKEIWQMKHPLVYNGLSITVKQAETEMDEYLDIVKKLIAYYKSQGKTVILAGHSYGGNEVNDFLRKHGTANADGFVSLASRLKGPASQAKLWKKRLVTNYKKDNSNNDGIFELATLILAKFAIPQEFAVAIFDGTTLAHDFTKEIKPQSLKHNNITWYSVAEDIAAGSFNEEEKAFAKKYGRLYYIDYPEVKKFHDELRKKYTEKYGAGTYNEVEEEIPHSMMFYKPNELHNIWKEIFDNVK